MGFLKKFHFRKKKRPALPNLPQERIEEDTESEQSAQNISNAQATQSTVDTPISQGTEVNIPKSELLSEVSLVTSSATSPELSQVSLWSKAYTKIKETETNTKWVTRYEEIVRKLTDEHGEHVATQEDRKPAEMGVMRTAVQVALDRTEKEAKVKGRVNEGIQVLNAFKNVITAAVKPSSEATLAWTCVTLSLELIANPVTESAAQRDGIEYVVSRMDWYWDLCQSALSESNPHNPNQNLRNGVFEKFTSLYETLLLFLMKSVCLYHQNRVVGTLRDFLKFDDWESLVNSIKAAQKELEDDLRQYTNQGQLDRLDSILKSLEASRKAGQDQLENVSHDECRKLIGKSIPEDTKSRILKEKGGMLPDCCSWFFHTSQFKSWRNNPDHRILWVSGDPGKGKTMLLCAIVDWFQNSHCVSYFFCKQDDANLNNEAAILRGLIYNITNKIPALMKHVEANKEGLGIEGPDGIEALSKTLKSVLRDPLASDTIILIDAFDECTLSGGKSTVLGLIAEAAGENTAKYVISSRNSLSAIRLQLGSMPQFLRLELEKEQEQVKNAVESYVHTQVNQLWQNRGLGHSKRAEVEAKLISKADGTFLWVSLVWLEVSNELANSEVPDEASFIMKTIETMPHGLDGIYERMVNQIQTGRNEALSRDMLRLIYFAYRPLTIHELQYLIEDQEYRQIKDLEKFKNIVHQSCLFVTITDNIVRFIHQSAKDFIGTFAFDLGFAVVPKSLSEAHYDIFTRLISIMYGSSVSDYRRPGLRQDIFEVGHPGRTKSELKRPGPDPASHLAYSCVYWVHHLVDSDCRGTESVQEVVCKFLIDHSLHWMELLGWLGEVPECIKQLNMLRGWASGHDSLKAWINDARRLILKFRPAVEEAPLQVYTSAHVFAPCSSLIKKSQNAPAWITNVSGIDKSWNDYDMILEHPGQFTQQVIWDGNDRLTSISDFPSGAACWDMNTGSRIRHLRVRKAAIDSIVATPNGQKIAWFMRNTSLYLIYVWDSTTGVLRKFEFGKQVEDYGSLEISLSKTGQFLVATGLGRSFLKVWDLTKGDDSSQAFWPKFIHFNEPQKDITFLTDTTFLSRSKNIIYLRNMDGKELRTFKADEHRGMMRISSDGSVLLCSGPNGNYIRLWEVQSGICLLAFGPEKDETFKLRSSLLSEDGKKVALDYYQNGIIKVWSVAADASCVTIDCGQDKGCVSFSRDGQLLASSCTKYFNIRIWDTGSGTHLATLNGHTDNILDLSFSPDNRRLASASTDYSVKIWDLLTANTHSNFYDSIKRTNHHVACSPDGKLFCAAGKDGSLTIYENNGQSIQVYLNYALAERSDLLPVVDVRSKPVFSLDGLKLAVICRSDRMKIWHHSESQIFDFVVFHTSRVARPQRAVSAFSATGDLLALGTAYELQIWDLVEYKRASTLRYDDVNLENWSARSIKFLRDGFHLVTGFHDGNIMLSDVSGRHHKTIQGQHDGISSIETILSEASEYLITSAGIGLDVWDVTDVESIRFIRSVDLGGPVYQLLRNPGSDFTVQTDCGVLHLDVPSWDLSTPRGETVSLCFEGFGLARNQTWVTYRGERVMWLPPECRSTSSLHTIDHKVWTSAVWGSALFIAPEGRDIITLSFSEDINATHFRKRREINK